MYFKLAFENIKKSFKDYLIYFITLTLAVCIFYNFNSMNSQTVMNDISKIKDLVKVISYISVFISVVFGGLIIYANSALLKKRKKEFGIYAVLGMAKRKISRILIYETFMVGVISLIIGLFAGILLSQGISVLTAKLFEFNMNEYTFIISTQAISKTVLYFGIMFLLVMIFNIVMVSKQKLIDMIKASKKNEKIITRNPIISAIIFILSLVVLGKAYYQAWYFAPTPKNIKFPLSAMWGGLGTLLFFFGLSGFIILIIKKNKQIYLKKLNIFVIKQFSNKINTNFISMTVTCLMLVLTILILSTSLSVKYGFEKELENSIPYDATIELEIVNKSQEVQDIKEALERVDFKLREAYNYFVVDYSGTDIKTADLLNEYANENLKDRMKNYVGRLGAINISQYNDMRRLNKQSTVELKENEVLLITQDDDEKQALQKLIEIKKEINIDGKNYVMKSNTEIEESNYNLMAVLPDSATEKLIKANSIMYMNNIDENYKEEVEEQVKELKIKFGDVNYDRDKSLNKYGFMIIAETKTQRYDEVKSGIGTILYIGVYLGFVFLVASAAVLAIQQLTDASDSLNRYKVLKKIGVSDHMINKTIFAQILIYFMLPLSLAIIHSGVALRIMEMGEFGKTSITIAFVIILIYGGYCYATYLGYKNIVKNT